MNVVGTITNGTLNTSSGGLMQSVGGGSDLSAVTISANSTFTVASGSQTQLDGAIVNQGTLALDGSTGDAIVNLGSDVTLSGGGTVTLTGCARRLPARQQSHPDQHRQHHPGRRPNWGQRRADGQE